MKKHMRSYVTFTSKERLGILVLLGLCLLLISILLLLPMFSGNDKELKTAAEIEQAYQVYVGSLRSNDNDTKRKSAKTHKSMLDLNQADSIQLTDIDGIGAKTAHRILQYRREYGKFHSIDALDSIPHLSKNQLERWKLIFYVDSNGFMNEY